MDNSRAAKRIIVKKWRNTGAQRSDYNFSGVELEKRSTYKRVGMNWARHARHRFCLTLVVSLLFCALSSSEIPELARLSDDTSNDYTLVVSTKTVAPIPAVIASSDAVLGTVPQVEDAVKYPGPSPISIPYAHTSPDYLQLLCVHRT